VAVLLVVAQQQQAETTPPTDEEEVAGLTMIFNGNFSRNTMSDLGRDCGQLMMLWVINC
jgi:hypothetical protein